VIIIIWMVFLIFIAFFKPVPVKNDESKFESKGINQLIESNKFLILKNDSLLNAYLGTINEVNILKQEIKFKSDTIMELNLRRKK
jgi:hypothetical protein